MEKIGYTKRQLCLNNIMTTQCFLSQKLQTYTTKQKLGKTIPDILLSSVLTVNEAVFHSI